MKRGLLLISMLFVLPLTLIGCATSGDLEKVQTEQKMLDAKVDQALQDAQAAKAAADEALMKANEATARAEAAEKRAEERERIANEKAKKAEAMFQKSMKK